jgi:hypothetical protein
MFLCKEIQAHTHNPVSPALLPLCSVPTLLQLSNFYQKIHKLEGMPSCTPSAIELGHLSHSKDKRQYTVEQLAALRLVLEDGIQPLS